MFKKTIIILSLFTIIFAATPVFSASNLLFTPLEVEVIEEESFSILVGIDAKGVKNYTVKLELEFPAEFLEITSFNFTSNWIALSQPGYDLIDNAKGLLIKTAGWPGGFLDSKPFGTVFFRAKKQGKGIIKAGAASFVLDAENQDVLTAKPEVSVVIIKKVIPEEVVPEEVVPEVEIPEEIPEYLFDINLEIDQYSIVDIKDLTSRVIFTSFGRAPTPVDLTFAILDEFGQEIYSEKDYLVVETEEVLTKKFEELEIPSGKYTLRLTTLYNIDVRDEFTQDFEIIKEEEERPSIFKSIWFWLPILAILALIGVIVKKYAFK